MKSGKIRGAEKSVCKARFTNGKIDLLKMPYTMMVSKFFLCKFTFLPEIFFSGKKTDTQKETLTCGKKKNIISLYSDKYAWKCPNSARNASGSVIFRLCKGTKEGVQLCERQRR